MLFGIHTMVYIFCKNLLVYTTANGAIWLAMLIAISILNSYRVAASNASFSQKNNAYSSFFETILKK